jgi:hypothetical protein
MPLVRPLADELPDVDDTSRPPEPPPVRHADADATAPSTLVRRATSTPAASLPTPSLPTAAAPAATAGIPSFSRLPATATTGLAPLSMELHVYSPDARERFVVINGQRLGEGGRLREGATVERITAEGAVLNYHGTRFQFP